MSAQFERSSGNVPWFGATLPRLALLRELLDAPECLCGIVAPAGYGKTVLAAQFSRSSRFAAAYWADCSGVRDARSLSSVIVRAIGGGESRDCVAAADFGLLPLSASSERLAEPLERLAQEEPVCLVLDGLQLEGLEDCLESLRQIAHSFKGLSKVILTARILPPSIRQSIGDMHVITAGELRLTRDELRDHALYIGVDDDALVTEILRITTGHAAFCDLLLRQHRLGTWTSASISDPPVSLIDRIAGFVRSQLNTRQRSVMLAAAVLGDGFGVEIDQACGDLVQGELVQVAECIPLVQVRRTGSLRFSAHDILLQYCLSEDFQSALGEHEYSDVLWRAIDVLSRRDDVSRGASVLLRIGNDDATADWLELHGQSLLELGFGGMVEELVNSIAPGEQVCRPRITLLSARQLRESGDFKGAELKARVVSQLAAAEGDQSLQVEALLTMGRAQIDAGQLASAASSFRDALDLADGTLRSDTAALVRSYAGFCLALQGKLEEGQPHLAAAADLLSTGHLSSEASAQVRNSLATALCFGEGDWRGAALLCVVSPGVRLSRLTELVLRGNHGTAMSCLGRLEQSRDELLSVIAECERNLLDSIRHSFVSSLASVAAGEGSYSEAEQLQLEADGVAEVSGDTYSLVLSLIQFAVWLRASRIGGSNPLSVAERALELTGVIKVPAVEALARCELAASLLFVDEMRIAEAIAARCSSEAGSNMDVGLRAALVLSELARRKGDLDAAIDHLRSQSDYILSENANWVLAMYCRAFPELLGVLVLAIDLDDLPAHFLAMILPENAERTLAATRDWLPEAQWFALGRRLLGDAEFQTYLERGGEPLCRVRLFGGLEVSVGSRMVSERSWRKRKARLLFALLVLNRGQDVSRDQLMDTLFPEMDEERARNNFYVVWSAMKAALMGDVERGVSLPYAENVRGVCRIVADSVRSDVEDFHRALSAAKESEEQGDSSSAVRAYRRLMELYRGDLLPGDVYEDAFALERDRYRIAFVDAMIRAARLSEDLGECSDALEFLRRALRADPLREELYREALRLHIEAGRRSAAIELYMQCRHVLAEELGLDPSRETNRLYEQVLAMEEEQPYADGVQP